MSEQNKALVRRAVDEVWNKGNFAFISEVAAADIVVRGTTPERDIHGPEGLAQFYAAIRTAFPDFRFTIEDQIAERDRVVTSWTATGTHTGEFQGIPPTGIQVKLAGIDIDRIAGGKIVECWPNADELGLLQQLGVLPAPV